MTITANDLARARLAELEQAAWDATARRMRVSAIEDGKVVLTDLASGDVYAQAYPRLVGPAIGIGDEVLVQEVPGIGPGSGSTRVVLGKLQRTAPSSIAFEVPLAGQPREIADDLGTITEADSSGDTSAYVTALTVAWPDLPDGTYRVVADGSLLAAHTAADRVNLRVMVGGSAGGSVSIPVLSPVPPTTRIAVASTFDAFHVSGGGGTTVKLQYRPGMPGIAYVSNPVLHARAYRTA
jgi:hypothetical protein